MTSPALTESDPISPRAEALEDPLRYIPGTKTPPSWRLGGASAKSECPLHQDNDGQGASRPATVDQPPGLRSAPLSHFTTCPGTPNGRPPPHPCPARPSSPTGPGGTHTSLAGSARPSTTRTFRELLLAMAPSPKLSDQEGARVPRLDRGRAGVYMSPAASLAPSLGVPGPPARNARVAGREVSEGGETIVTGEGAPPSPDSTGRSRAPSWQSARGTHRQPLPSSLALLVGQAGRAVGGWATALPAIPPPAGSPSRQFPGPPRAPSAGTPAKRARAHPPRSPGLAEVGTARWGAAHGHDGRGGRLLLSWHWAQKT